MDAVVEVAERPTTGSSQVSGHRSFAAIVATLLVAALGAWWTLGGTHVRAPQGNLVGQVAARGELASVGMPLIADGSGARLQAVHASVTPGAALEWSAYQQLGDMGFGSSLGPLEPTWSVDPVRGAPVSHGPSGTWIIASLSSNTPGVYRVSDISVDYRSGWRSRTEDSAFAVCVLVLPDGASAEEFEASDAPLWQDYLSCLGENG